MKIKYLAIALFSTTLLSSPLLADKVKPVNTMKEMYKSSPSSLAIQTSTDKMEVAKKKAENKLHKESLAQGSNPLHKSVDGMSSETEVVESSTGGVYIKIDDIKGDTGAKASSAIPPSINGLEVTAPTKASPKTDTSGSKGNRAVTATDYNSSRSNKADGVTAPDSNNDDDETGDESDSKATDYNSSRSNKSFGTKLDTDTDIECDTEKEKKVCVTTETHTVCSCTHL